MLRFRKNTSIGFSEDKEESPGAFAPGLELYPKIRINMRRNQPRQPTVAIAPNKTTSPFFSSIPKRIEPPERIVARKTTARSIKCRTRITYHHLSINRIMRYAATNGNDAIAIIIRINRRNSPILTAPLTAK